MLEHLQISSGLRVNSHGLQLIAKMIGQSNIVPQPPDHPHLLQLMQSPWCSIRDPRLRDQPPNVQQTWAARTSSHCLSWRTEGRKANALVIDLAVPPQSFDKKTNSKISVWLQTGVNAPGADVIDICVEACTEISGHNSLHTCLATGY